jgi:outer membrane protein OmpA-like peptidoglycan-associated protein
MLSKQNSNLEFGGFTAISYNMHSGSFSQLPPISTCCPEYKSGSGMGFMAGGFMQLRFAQRFAALARVGYASMSASFNPAEQQTILLPQPTLATIEHYLQAKLALLFVESRLLYSPWQRFHVGLGLVSGLTVESNYVQEERLIAPENGTFENNQRVRNRSTGVLPGGNPRYLGLSLSAGISLPLNPQRTLFLVPELQYWHGLNRVVFGQNWYAGALTGSFALRYVPGGDPDIIEEEKIAVIHFPVIPSLGLPDPPQLNLQMLAFDSLKVDKTDRSFSMPLLPYVFFDSASAELPQQYMHSAQEELNPYGSSAPQLHAYILDIIGKRMQNNASTLLITGHGDADENSVQQRNLAKARALAVQRYLQEIWKLPAQRLKIVFRPYPRMLTRNDMPEGRQENRRVELSSQDNSLFQPFILKDTLLTTLQQGRAVIVGHEKAYTPIVYRAWGILDSDGKLLQSKEFKDGDTLVFNSATYPANGNALRLFVRDTLNRTVQSQIPLQFSSSAIYTHKSISEIYDLILFPYNSASISADQAGICRLIAAGLNKHDTVEILGYTDKLGDDQVNKTLALQRAQAIADLFKEFPQRVYGFGEEQSLYPGISPVERFYNRTVRLIIRRAE